jgi:hypothetical protein
MNEGIQGRDSSVQWVVVDRDAEGMEIFGVPAQAKETSDRDEVK